MTLIFLNSCYARFAAGKLLMMNWLIPCNKTQEQVKHGAVTLNSKGKDKSGG
jgi:hypothetical protein